MEPEIMTVEEMRERFPSEWVLIDAPVQDERLEVLGGKVVFHSQSRKEVDEMVNQLPIPRDFAVRFLGKMPKDRIFVL